MKCEKITQYIRKNQIRCHDCGVEEGKLHKKGCDNDFCPICGMQLMCCEHGWEGVDDEDREPFFMEVFNCERCGKTFPLPNNMVSDELWGKICGNTYPKDCILCRSCMDFIIKKRGLEEENAKSNT